MTQSTHIRMTNDEGVTAKKLRVWNPALDESHEAPLEERREVAVTQPTKIIPQTVPPSSTHFNAPLNLLFQNYAQLAGPYIARLQADNFAACQPFMVPPRCPLPPPRVLPLMMNECMSNPIVQGALGAVGTPNQNCCAICGSVFRLTADLVQHMRANHRSSKFKRAQKRTH